MLATSLFLTNVNKFIKWKDTVRKCSFKSHLFILFSLLGDGDRTFLGPSFSSHLLHIGMQEMWRVLCLLSYSGHQEKYINQHINSGFHEQLANCFFKPSLPKYCPYPGLHMLFPSHKENFPQIFSKSSFISINCPGTVILILLPGTCTNQKSDDAMKRNGKVVKYFKEMALDWKVPYPTNRYCNPGVSQPSKIEYHQHCVPSNLCKIIW